MAMHNALHPKSNVDQFYIIRKKGGRALQGVKETVKLTNLVLENNVKESRERLLTAARSVDIYLIEPIRETTIETKKKKKEGKNNFFSGKNIVSPLYTTNYEKGESR